MFIALPFAAVTSTGAGSRIAVGTSFFCIRLWSHPVSNRHLCVVLHISTSMYVSGINVLCVTVFDFKLDVSAAVAGADCW